jgi:hypothetical protein
MHFLKVLKLEELLVAKRRQEAAEKADQMLGNNIADDQLLL